MTDFEKRTYKSLQKRFLLEYSSDPIAVLPFDISDDSDALVDGTLIVYDDHILKIVHSQIVGKYYYTERKLNLAYLFGYVRLELLDNDGNGVVICKATLSKKEMYASVLSKIQNGYGADAFNQKKSKERMSGRISKLFRLIKSAGSQKISIVIAVLLFLVITALDLIIPVINSILIDDYIVTKNRNFTGFFAVLFAMLLFVAVSKLLGVLRSRILCVAGYDIIYRLRNKVFKSVSALSCGDINRYSHGDILQRVLDDTTHISNFIVNEFPQILGQGFILLGVAAIICVYDIKLAFLLFIPLPLFVIVTLVFRRRTERMYYRQQQSGRALSSGLLDVFRGIRLVKSYGAEEYEEEKFHKLSQDECNIRQRNERFWAVFNPIINLIVSFGEFALLYYAGGKLLDGSMSYGTMQMLSSYVGLIYGPIRVYSMIPRWTVRVANSSARVFELCDEKPSVKYDSKIDSFSIEGKIEFKNVSFGYTSDKEVLHNINITVNPGEMVGIVGRTGVGKSTLINLLMRFYDPCNGKILIDSHDLRDISEDFIRKNIGAVLQDVFLFEGTIYDNILYGDPLASKEDVLRVAHIAGVHDFASKLKDGYDTQLGERGAGLSVGERQRVAIARTLLQNPKILILDEATSSLDVETERKIQNALSELMKDKTTVAIAHRLSTLKNADRIIVLDGGYIIETGTHQELMEKRGLYYNLVLAQRKMSGVKSL